MDGKYKVIFFVTEHRGRVSQQDATTIKLVLDAAPEIKEKYVTLQVSNARSWKWRIERKCYFHFQVFFRRLYFGIEALHWAKRKKKRRKNEKRKRKEGSLIILNFVLSQPYVTFLNEWRLSYSFAFSFFLPWLPSYLILSWSICSHEVLKSGL